MEAGADKKVYFSLQVQILGYHCGQVKQQLEAASYIASTAKSREKCMDS